MKHQTDKTTLIGRMRQGWGRRELLCCFLLLFFCGTMRTLFRDLTNVDEFWNYNFASNIANGLVPYRDFNLLQTPMSCMINALALRIFGRHLVVMRMMGVLLFSSIGTVLYAGARQLGFCGILCMIYPLCFVANYDYNIFFEYSCLIIFCQLVMLYVDLLAIREEEPEYAVDRRLKGNYDRLWMQFLLGIFGGIAVMSKQTYGGFVMLAAWISLGLVCRWRGKDLRTTVKMLFFRMLGSSVPCFGVLFYLLYHRAWGDFWEMCVLGISTFSSHYSLLSFVVKGNANDRALAVCFVALLLCCILRLRQDHRVQLITLCGILGCINLIPLANTYHVLTCMVVFWWVAVPVFLYVAERMKARFAAAREETAVQEKTDESAGSVPERTARRKNRREGILDLAYSVGEGLIHPILWLLCLACTGYLVLLCPVRTIIYNELLTGEEHLEYTWISREDAAAYYAVEDKAAEYLSDGEEVYILDNFAPLYLIPLNRYHKNLDMFLVGNLGMKTPEECLVESLAENSVYLLPSEDRKQSQYPKSAVNSFRDEYLEKAGEIEDFEIWVPKA